MGDRMTVIARSTLMMAAVVATLSAEHLDILWIGNSLTQGSPGCYSQGWAWAGAMASHDSARTGVSVHCGSVMKGATDLCGHWAAGETDASRTELADPTGGSVWAPGLDCIDARDHYDYVVLQGYRWGAPYDEELQCAINYADLALSYGTKPIFFVCWQNPADYDGIVGAYDSLYNRYKDQGALIAPVFQAHKLVIDDPEVDAETLLYGTDTYHHDSNVGAYLKMCVFFEVFSAHSAEDFDIASFRDNVCWGPDELNTNGVIEWADYMEEKAHQAVTEYYATTGSKAPVRQAPNLSAVPGPVAVYSLDGRLLTVAGSPASVRQLRAGAGLPSGTYLLRAPTGAVRAEALVGHGDR
jgi:hypothetical protein